MPTFVWYWTNGDGSRGEVRGEGAHAQDAFTKLTKKQRAQVTYADGCCTQAEYEAREKAKHMKVPTTYEHFDKYRALAEKLGVKALKRLVLIIADKDRIIESLSRPEKHLNDIPLHKWDNLHGSVVELARRVHKGKFGWSLSDSVCVLKHVATYFVAEAEFEGACTLCNAPFERRDTLRGDALCAKCEA